MNIIAAVSKDWGIGKGDELLFHIPEDMKFFRSMTLGKIVIMGRKTLDSFPGGEPLKNRTNIVITRNPDFNREGVITAHDIDEAVSIARGLEGYTEDDIFIIGGDSIYGQMLSFADTAYITKVEALKEADAFFPELDDCEDWKLDTRSEIKDYNGIPFYFATYVRLTGKQ
jgi:dihydrofolate reductase